MEGVLSSFLVLQMMGKEAYPRVFAVCPLLSSVSVMGNSLGRVRGCVGSSQADLGWTPGFLFLLLVKVTLLSFP